MEEKNYELTTRGKYAVGIGAILLVLLLCFGFLAFGGSEPPADYTGIWETHDKHWVYYEKGEVEDDYTGAAEGSVNKRQGTYYVNNGEVDLTYTGLGASEAGWVYFDKGVFDNTFTGFARTGNDWYWVKNGVVDRSVTGTKSGTIEGETTWWYIEDGQAALDFDGPAKTKSGICYFKNGKLDQNYSGIKLMDDTWYYFSKGRQDKKYKGISTNEEGVWFVQNGKVDFNYTGKVTHLGRTYKVKDGVVGNGKAVYLTFDDGPGQYTGRLLGILDHHKVKATFFVTGFFKSYLDCLEREARAGHTIGVHTYTHDYGKIYTYLTGLSIGVHLLNLLCIPAIV
ncbi:MAG: polysaccharide deacetylase family protein, partial [Clostridia bacterium]|nr:polysaccharide deacetylase family protein [Clostridia bacterium]